MPQNTALSIIVRVLSNVRGLHRAHRQLERLANDAQDRTRIVWSLAVQHDLRPSVARELFRAYRHENPCDDWRLSGQMLLASIGGIRWMTEQIAALPQKTIIERNVTDDSTKQPR